MVAGRSPVWGPTGLGVVAANFDREPVPPARFGAGSPGEAQRILTKTLRKDRSQRYQTVQDLLLDLQALREDSQSHARSGNTPVAPITTEPPTGSTTTAVLLSPHKRRRWLRVA